MLSRGKQLPEDLMGNLLGGSEKQKGIKWALGETHLWVQGK